MKSDKDIKITIYKWEGSWGPFKIKIPCGECTLTQDIISDVIKKELSDIPIVVEGRKWLSEWWKPLFRGGFHAPIVMVGDKVVSQGGALNRGVFVEQVVNRMVLNSKVKGNVIYGKDSCPYCVEAKKFLDQKGIEYTYYNVIENTRALYEMIPRVKAHIGQKTPVTVPQIWIDGEYIGGMTELRKIYSINESSE